MPLQYTLDQLLLLDAIARTGSFAAAARELHRVPSAASYTIRNLEEALGVELFDRAGHRAELTVAGRMVLEHARDVLREARRLDAAAAQLREGWEPELRLVVDGALPMAPLADAMRTFSVRQVPTRIRVDVEYQDGVPDRFFSEGAHIMLVLELDAVPSGMLSRALTPLEMVLVVGATHPLAGQPRLPRKELHRWMELVVKDSSPPLRPRPPPLLPRQHQRHPPVGLPLQAPRAARRRRLRLDPPPPGGRRPRRGRAGAGGPRHRRHLDLPPPPRHARRRRPRARRAAAHRPAARGVRGEGVAVRRRA